jgi:UDP-2-acetamido-2-deoxy-ribo-hexuluronate aminotransferase
VLAQQTVQLDRRDEVAALLNAQGIPTAVHYPRPLHLQPAYAAVQDPQAFAQARRAAARVLSLPMSADLADADLDRVVQALDAAVARLRA